MALVLVIDDDPQMRTVLKRCLSENKHSVLDAADGREGLWMFRDRRPDLVITDLIMPGKEGIETIREIRNEVPDAKIIAISGGGMTQDHRFLKAAQKLGANIVIQKPLKMAALVEAVNSLLEDPGPLAKEN
jgi:CheY-like chemotaxis protein